MSSKKPATPQTTPKQDSVRRGTKRTKHRQPGSESSVDGDLSYLDLGTGNILSAARENDEVTLTFTEFDKLVSKIDKMQQNFDKFDKLEKCLSKLDKLDKLDAIEISVRDLNVKVYDMNERLRVVETDSKEIQRSPDYLSTGYDTLKTEQLHHKQLIDEHSKIIQNLSSENETLKKSFSDIRDLHNELKAQLIDSKCREMRDNLVFTNIHEVMQTSRTGAQFEDTENVLTDFLSSKLNLHSIKFERVHRVPTRRDTERITPRPIVAKFSFFKDREEVRRPGYLLRGTRFGINEQFPEEIEKKRRELYPLMRFFRAQNKRTVLVRDRLFVDGREVRAGEVDISQEQRTSRVPYTGSGGRGRGAGRQSRQRWGSSQPSGGRAHSQRYDPQPSTRKATESTHL